MEVSHDLSFPYALTCAAAWVGTVSLVTGLLLVRRRTAQGPPHPFMSAAASGLLTGISCLVILPEALDQLPREGWTISQVLALFIGSAAIMFFLDHSIMEHTHVGRGERLPTMPTTSVETTPPKDDEEPPAVEKAADLEVPGSSTTSGASSTSSDANSEDEESGDKVAPQSTPMSRADAELEASGELMCEEATGPLPHAPVAWCPCHGGDPFAKGVNVISFNKTSLQNWRAGGCPVVAQRESVLASPPPSPPPPAEAETAEPAPEEAADLEQGHAYPKRKRERLRQSDATQPTPAPSSQASTPPLGPSSCQRASAVSVRVGAWMLHAMVDGMVLASAPSTTVLLATALPVTLCALQDVAAFTVTMARLGFDSPRVLTAAVVALSCAFPLGALLSHAALSSAASESAVNVVRTVVAGVFVYMALFELAPPHTHNRIANTIYLLCFVGAAALAYSVDVVQELLSGAVQ